MSHYDQIDYSKYPGTIAPRRFELINTKISDDAVFGHGVEMYSGMCLIERPGAIECDKSVGFASIEWVQRTYHIRWIDPPFVRSKEEESG